MAHGRQYAAFGESKGLYQWAADPRCLVAPNTLTKRVRGGWPVEAAMTTRGRGYTEDPPAELTAGQAARLTELTKQAAGNNWRAAGHPRRRDALEARDSYIRGLLDGGVRASAIVAASGLSRPRVYQIRGREQRVWD